MSESSILDTLQLSGIVNRSVSIPPAFLGHFAFLVFEYDWQNISGERVDIREFGLDY